MSQSVPNQAVRVFAVLLCGAVVYALLGSLVYYVYFSLDDNVYDRKLDEGHLALQALFYLALMVHFTGAVAVVAALTRRLAAPRYAVVALGVVLLSLAAYLTIGTLSFLNACESGESFPIRGVDC